MSDPRQQYHGWVARNYGPGIKVRRQSEFYWTMSGRAWFRFLRKASVSKRVKYVFDHPMSHPIRQGQSR